MDTVIELEILPGTDPGSYTVHVLRSVGGGEPMSSFTLDLDELVDRRPQLEQSILASAVMARRVVPTTEAAIQDVGRRLFDAVFQGDVHTAYRTSVAVASERGKGIQLVLRLTAPGLVALPWETLFDPETGTYLCRKEPLVRRVPARHAPAALAIEPPLRILGMVSSPRGLPALDVEAEKALLEDALRPQIDAGRVKISWVEPVTWSAVHDRLLSREWHVIHFIGHGTYDPETDEGLLAFVGNDGRTHNVPASSLADLIDEAEPSPRLVLLNTCSSGTGGRDDLFSGTAGALAHSGIHAVAAMQFEISDRAAIEFSRGFYAALAHGRRIDDAVRSGRIEILGLGQGTLEWVTPVLYLRGDDTRLFDVAPVTETGVVTTTDAPSGPLPVPVPTPTTPPAEGEQAQPQPPAHAADSGDVPSTIIPIIRLDSAPTPTTAGRDASTALTDVDDVIPAAPTVTPWWAAEETARQATTKPIPLPPVAAPDEYLPLRGPESPDSSSDGPGGARRSSFPVRRFVLLAILAIITIGVVVVVVWMGSVKPEVPVFADGATWVQARDDLRELGLDPAQKPESSETLDPGIVIRTIPVGGREVEPGQSVDVYVSTGPAKRNIPPLVDMPWPEAEANLLGLRLTPTKQEESNDLIAFGNVIRTEPAAGQEVERDAQVTVYVSTGPEIGAGDGNPEDGGNEGGEVPAEEIPPELVELPNYSTWKIDEAENDAQSRGFGTTRQPGEACINITDLVVDQSPPPGPVETGTTIVLIYCTSGG